MVEAFDENHQKITKKVAVWNPTVANLTLMALGSSAPEILLSVIETVSTLGATPGELGPSTIVGSAAYNLLAISAVSVMAISPENDERDEEEIEEDGCPKGVHKINDMGVFTITTTWSVIAYMWLYYCLMDGQVTVIEAILTFSFFWIMLIMAFIADKINRQKTKERLDKKFGAEAKKLEDSQKPGGQNVSESQLRTKETRSEETLPYKAIDMYNLLIKDELGELHDDDNDTKIKLVEMRAFLQKHFGTDKASEIEFT